MASSSEEDSFEVAEILGARKKGRSQEYLVRWKGYGAGDDTWEPVRNLRKSVELIKQYEEKLQAPENKVKQQSIEGSAVKRGSSKSATVITTTLTSNTGSELTGSLSASSSPESSPRVTRKVITQTETITKTSGGTEFVSKKTSKTISTTGMDSSPVTCLCPFTMDFPTIIQLISFTLIAASFVLFPIN